jgi:steroid 5-alpha reductase family enzyme
MHGVEGYSSGTSRRPIALTETPDTFPRQEEDYRWAVIRKGMHPIIFQLFNFFFIGARVYFCYMLWFSAHSSAVVQSILLMSLSFPVYLAVKGSHEALTTADYALFVTGLVVLGVEGTADNQQYAYQTFKRMFLEREKKFNDSDVTKVSLPASAHWPFAMMAYSASDARRGFITKGLWAWSRHPNFLCEQTFWVSPSSPHSQPGLIHLSPARF